ncbi:MAG: RNA methyltransferase TrmH family [Rhodospirillaceae bacterium]|nr:MAG: RNA methyltransferase TrmH family [Rhodospirillaceae bacterium]
MAERIERTITSLHHPIVKLVRALDRRKVRRAEGIFVAEGLKVIATGRDRGWVPRFLLMREDADAGDKKRMSAVLIAWAAECGVPCLALAEPAFAKVAARDNPQDLIAVFAQRWKPLPPAAPEEKGVWVVLEEVRDPGNLGTIVRTADAVGAKGVLLVGACCDPYSREAVRATMGSIFNVPLARMEQEAFRAWSAAWPGTVVGAAPAAGEDFRGHYREPVLLIMGGEGPGLSPALAETCTRLVRIPMTGSVDSLNLAIATAVMLYEIRREVLAP